MEWGWGKVGQGVIQGLPCGIERLVLMLEG